MATLDWSQCPAMESVPGKVSGAWVFRDTRLPVATVIENLEDLSIEEVMEPIRRDAGADRRGPGVCRAEPASVRTGASFNAGQCSSSLTTNANRYRPPLHPHAVITAKGRGWDRLANGSLLAAAEDAGVDVLLTTDQRIRYSKT